MAKAVATVKRPIYEIARDIKNEWRNVFYGAVPYLDAMLELTDSSSKYGADDAKGILLYFLSNAGTFRGGNAATLKTELKSYL